MTSWQCSKTRMELPGEVTVNRSHPAYRLRDHVLPQLGSAVGYQRRTGDDIDRKVIAHVAEYGRVSNATVRNLLDLTVTRASAILRDLVERGVLERTTPQRRGPSVEYGPGPRFPRAVRKTRSARRQGSEPAATTLFEP